MQLSSIQSTLADINIYIYIQIYIVEQIVMAIKKKKKNIILLNSLVLLKKKQQQLHWSSALLPKASSNSTTLPLATVLHAPAVDILPIQSQRHKTCCTDSSPSLQSHRPVGCFPKKSNVFFKAVCPILNHDVIIWSLVLNLRFIPFPTLSCILNRRPFLSPSHCFWQSSIIRLLIINLTEFLFPLCQKICYFISLHPSMCWEPRKNETGLQFLQSEQLS